ncbi:MAG: hypothetical protein LBU88_04160 [Treponema sp.]|jgi:hypothetical protein|nr:hypothetical protein [Treponema sp.]
MKNLTKLTAFLVAVLLLAGCGNHLSSRYVLVLPIVPDSWTALLGQPCWRIEWIDPDGQFQRTDILPGGNLTVELSVTWTNPVTAWPWWADSNIIPGLFKPAGGFFPYEVSGGQLCLSWEAGPDTVFYWELIYANTSDETKIPANFDWLRFRELFATGVLGEEVCKDPWLVNWKSVAERTIASNFDRRRLVPEAAIPLAIPVGTGYWYSTSPFADPLFFTENDPPVFPVRPGVNAWISEEGILRVSGNTWTLSPYNF